ncbi:translocation/assembly module TamB domain-containing protein [Aliikangiella sp. IMCC44653]
MKKFLRRFVFVILAILFLGTCVTFWIYASERGLNWAINIARPYLPQTITLGKVSGTLDTKLYIDSLIIQQPEQSLELKKAILECDWTELLYFQVSCQSLVVSKLNLVTSSQKSASGNQQLPQLHDFKLPINIRVNSAQIKQFALLQKEQLADANSSQLTIDSIILKSLLTAGSKIQFNSLSAKYHQHQMNLAGSINTHANWPIDIEFLVQPNNKSLNANQTVTLEFNIKGEIKRDARYAAVLTTPLTAKTSGRVSWQKGLQLKEGNLQLSQNSLKQQNFINLLNSWTIDNWQATYQIEWPKLEFDLKTSIQHPTNAALRLDTSLLVDDILNWTNNTQLPLSIKGHFTEKSIQQLSSEMLSSSSNAQLKNQRLFKDDAQPLQLSLQAELNVNKNELNVALFNSYLDELNIESNFKTLATNFDEYQGNIRVSLANSFENFGLFANNIKATLEFHKVSGNRFPSTTIQATANQLSYSNFAFSELNIKANNIYDSNNKINFDTKVTSKNAHLINNKISDITLALNGNQHNHQLNLKFNHQPLKVVDLSATAALNFSTETQWLISSLKIHSAYEKNNLKLVANGIRLSASEQTADSYCFHFNGQVCGSFKNTKNRQQMSLAFTQFDSLALSKLAGQFIGVSNYQLESILNGKLELTAEDFKLLNLMADLNSANFTIKYPQGETSLVGFSLQSFNNSNAIKINWEALNQQSEIADINAKLHANQGQVDLQISSLEAISLDLNVNNISWNSQLSTAKKISEILVIDSLNLSTKLNDSNLMSSFNFNINSTDHISGKLAIEDVLNPNSPINGELDVNLKNFEWLKQWQSRIDQVTGRWQQQAQIKGNLNKPLFYGEGRLIIDRFTIQELGLDISDSEIALNGDHQLLNLNGVLKNKQGNLNLQGEMKVYPNLEANLKVYGNELLLIDAVDNRVVASPDISLSLKQQLLEVGGKITINEAKVKILSLPKQAVKVSDDQIIIGESAQEDGQLDYKVDIVLTTGDKVSIDGFGLTSKIKGDLNALIDSNQPIKVNGQLSLIDGKFEKYKQVLSIDEGQLLFLGPPENPGIQFKASRNIDNIKVGIIADGSVNNPRLTLFSQPAMSNEQILSLLITGRSIESLNESEGNALANAAINLGIEGANKVAQKIGEALGLNSLSLTSKTKADSTRVELGAKINDQLNLSYGTSISSSNEFQAGWIIQYQLTPSISFEAISGEEMSANLIYKKTFKADESKD